MGFFLWTIPKGLRDYDKALALNSQNPGALAGKGWMYLHIQNYDQAEKYLSGALRILPGYLGAEMGLMECAKNRKLAAQSRPELARTCRCFRTGIRYPSQGPSAEDIYFIAKIQAEMPKMFGNLSVRSSNVFPARQSAELMRGASYGSLVTNIASFIASHPRQAVNLDAAVCEVSATEMTPKGRRVIQFNLKRVIPSNLSMKEYNRLLSLAILQQFAHVPNTGNGKPVSFAGSLVVKLFAGTIQQRLERTGATFFTPQKQRLIVAFAQNDTATVTKILASQEVSSVADGFMASCF